MSRRPNINCMFCGDQGVPRCGEDVFPRWLCKKLAFSASGLHEEMGLDSEPWFYETSYNNLESFVADMSGSEPPGQRATSKRVAGALPTGRKLPDVCETCNRGWMSRLESGAKLLMPGFMLGKQKFLDPYDQVVLATWMVKTCFTYDASRQPRFISEELGSRGFFQFPFPPQMCQVQIGHAAEYLPDGSLVHGKQPLTISSLSDPVTEPNAVRFVFQFDDLMLQAVINFGTGVRATGVGAVLPELPNFEQIWPERGRFLWPSDAALTASGRTGGTEEPVTDKRPDTTPGEA